MEFTRRGVMLVLASPSGAGKSSISRALFEDDPNIALSVSVTTRERRTDEIDGKHYHFIDADPLSGAPDEPDERAGEQDDARQLQDREQRDERDDAPDRRRD